MAINAEQMDMVLKNKLICALLSESNIVELDDAEDMVLQHYLGEYYYHKFFAEE